MRIEELLYSRGYRVSEDGISLNSKNKKVGYKSDNGYMYIRVRVGSERKSCRVHRLQAFQKYGQALYGEGIVGRHKNGNPLDNSWENILIGTASDNMMDIPEQVRIKKALHATSFVRKYEKEEVRSYYENVKSYKKTMEKFGISSKGTLHFILNSKI